MSNKLKCLSLNVRGLQGGGKRQDIMYWLKKQKADVYCLQETHCGSENDVLRWSRQWEGLSYWTCVSTRSCGVAILVRKNCPVVVSNIQKEKNGRLICIDVNIEGKKYRIINLYAPNNGTERQSFFSETVAQYLGGDCPVIMGGDYNCTLRESDRRDCVVGQDRGRHEVHNLMHAFGLDDVYHKKYPENCMYTYFKPNSTTASRIDHWLTCKTLAPFVQDVGCTPCALSDHWGIFLHVKLTDVERGNNRWQMNESVIKSNMFKEMFTTFWGKWRLKKKDYVDLRIWWEDGKEKIQDIAMWCSKQLKNSQDQRIKQIETELITLQNRGELHCVEIDKLNRELKILYQNKAEGARVRAKTQWAEDGEMSSAYFHRLEKIRAVDKLWVSIKDKEGNTVTGIENILCRQVEFYETLYKSQGIDDESADILLNSVQSKLTEQDREVCDSKLTIGECDAVIKKLELGKSPGIDGITYGFYKMYWNTIREDFMDVVGCIEEKQELCPTQYTGLIRLLYKSGDREDMANWRPITLLNCDYKIIEKMLAKRLQLVLPKIIKEEQKGFMCGRHIEESIRQMEDIIDYCQVENVGGAILCIDQSKAFDRVEWAWLDKVMERFGFGYLFRNWIKTLYKNANSCILTNGFMSKMFEISRSVRQGSPLGPYLYILQSEVLAEYVRHNINIKGIVLTSENEHVELKLGTFADDTQAYVANEDSIERWFETLELYSKASGAKINPDKTEGILLGPSRGTRPGTDKIQWVDGNVKVLGISQGLNRDRKEYWEAKITKIERQFKLWKYRNLTLQGKVYLVKCYGLGMIQHCITCITVPDEIVKRLENIMWKFIWGNTGRELVKREICIRSVENGGLGMPNIRTIIKASRVQLLMKILTGDKDKWKFLPMKYIQSLDRTYGDTDYVLKAKVSVEDLTQIPVFYQECIKAFWEIKSNENVPLNVTNIMNQYLWGNGAILSQGNVVHDQEWCRNGVRRVKDILSTTGGVDIDNLLTKVPQRADFYIKLNKYMKVIPKEWLEKLRRNNDNDTPNNDEQDFNMVIIGKERFNLFACKRKELYMILMPTHETSRVERYWAEKFALNVNDCTIFYMSQGNKMLERKVREFKWKLINRCLTTEAKLKHIAHSDGTCKLCGIEKEDEEHILNCESQGEYWNYVNRCMSKIKDIPMNEKLLVIGYAISDVEGNVINCIIEEAKWVAWKRRCIVRYEDKWVNDVQMIELYKARINNRIEVLSNSEKWKLQFEEEITLLKYSL